MGASYRSCNCNQYPSNYKCPSNLTLGHLFVTFPFMLLLSFWHTQSSFALGAINAGLGDILFLVFIQSVLSAWNTHFLSLPCFSRSYTPVMPGSILLYSAQNALCPP